MTVSVEERNETLERAWAVYGSNNFGALIEILSKVSESDLLAEPELGVMLSFAWLNTGEWERALDVVRLVERPIRARGNTRLYRRRINLEAQILLNQGRVPEAQGLWQDLVEASHEADDEVTLAWANSNLAIVADIQCRWEESLLTHQRALAAYHRLGDRQALGCVHHNLAMTYRQLGLYSESDAHFEYAEDHFRTTRSEAHLALSDMERALLLSLTGDFRLAKVTANRAFQRFSQLGHTAGQGDTLRVLGMIAAGAGERIEARQYFEDGLELIQSVDRLTEAEILGEMAVLDLSEGKLELSRNRAEAACDIYMQLGAAPRADRLRARLERTEGRKLP